MTYGRNIQLFCMLLIVLVFILPTTSSNLSLLIFEEIMAKVRNSSIALHWKIFPRRNVLLCKTERCSLYLACQLSILSVRLSVTL